MSNRLSRTEWQALIDEQAASGLTQKVFCEGKEIPVATPGYWKRKLCAETTAEPAWFTEGSPAIPLDDWIDLELGNGLCLRLRQG